METTQLIRELSGIFDSSRVLTDAASLVEYGRDWTKYLQPKPSAIVFPKSTDEVVALEIGRAHV